MRFPGMDKHKYSYSICINTHLELGVKSPQPGFNIIKKFPSGFELEPLHEFSLIWNGQNATSRSSIGALTIVRCDIKYTRIILKLAKFTFMLANMVD